MFESGKSTETIYVKKKKKEKDANVSFPDQFDMVGFCFVLF